MGSVRSRVFHGNWKLVGEIWKICQIILKLYTLTRAVEEKSDMTIQTVEAAIG